MTDLSGAGVRVLLIGTATHHGPTLTSVPAVRGTVAALEQRLLSVCGVRPDRLRVVLDPPDAHTLAAAITQEAQWAETVLLVYYVGHGLLGPGGELYLAATSTDTLTPGLAAHQALPFSAVREALTACRADAVVLILDCCFSGRAGLAGRAPEPVFAPAQGTYLLASAEQLALAPAGQEHTTFSGALIRLLDAGDPRGPRRLTLDDIYDHLFRVLREQGGPLPRRQAGDRAGGLVVAPNRAQPEPTEPTADGEPEPGGARCPYAGLSSFGVEDAEFFRGRRALVDELLAASARTLAGSHPLVVIGASGAGKSSLLHAGLLATLRHGTPLLPGATGWPSMVFTPGERPVEELAARLHPDGAAGAGELRADPASAARLLEKMLAERGAQRLVIVIDQLEQLFTLCPDAEERAAFLRAVAALAQPPAGAPEPTPATGNPEPTPATGNPEPTPATGDPETGEAGAEPPGRNDRGETGAERTPQDGRAETRTDQLGGPDSGRVGTERTDGDDRGWAGTDRPGWHHRGAADQAVPATAGRGARALVVMALRADLYGQAAAHPELVDALRENQLLVGPMTVDELRAAIQEPAAAVGLLLDDGLADIMLHELGATRPSGPEAGSLPLLSHALWATWQRRTGDRMTVHGYRSSGGIAQAIATTADQTYAGLDAAGQQAVRRMLPRLVRVDDDRSDSTRTADLASLNRGLPDPVAAGRALHELAEARLVTLDRDTARLSHEALLREWPLLRQWVDADREWLRAHQRLAADALAWQRAGLDQSLLYRGSRLAAVRERAAESAAAGDLEPTVAEFLDHSVRQERRATKLRVTITAGLVVLLLLAIAGGGTAFAFQRQAVKQRNVALARLVAAEADKLRAAQPGLAKQLSLVAYRFDNGAGTGPVMASQQTPGVYNATEPAVDLAQSGDGRLLVISTGTSIALWDTSTGRQWGRTGAVQTGPVVSSNDGAFLAAGTGRLDLNASEGKSPPLDEVRLWDTADPAHPRRIARLRMLGENVTALALSPDNRLLVAATTSGKLRVWDVGDRRSPQPLTTLTGHAGAVDGLAFAPDGKTLATSGTDHLVRLWDITKPDQLKQLSTVDGSKAGKYAEDDRVMPHRLAFSPDGEFLATVAGADSSEKLRIWKVANPRRPRPAIATQSDFDTCRRISSLSFNRTGGLVASGCAEGASNVRLWRFLGDTLPIGQNLEPGAKLEGGSQLGQVLFRPGTTLLMNASNGGVRMWDTANPWQPGALSTLPLAPDGFNLTVAFNPVGRRLLAATGANGTHLYEIGDPRKPQILEAYPGSGNERGSAVGFSPDGKLYAVSELDGDKVVVRLRRTEDAPRIGERAIDRPSGSPAATPSGRVPGTRPSGGKTGDQTAGGTPVPTPPISTITDLANGAHALAFSPDGRTLAVVDNAEYVPARTGPPGIRLYDLTDPAHPRPVNVLYGGAVFDLAYSPNGRLLAGFTADTMLLWDVTDPGHPVTLGVRALTPGSDVAAGAFSRDGRLLAVGDSAGAVRLWRVRADRLAGEPTILHGLGSRLPLALSPNGHTLAVSGTEQGSSLSSVTELWDLDSGSANLTARFATGLVLGGSLAFSPDGLVLAVMNGGSVDLWATDPGWITGVMCRSVGDIISEKQWNQYVPGAPYQPPCP